MQNEKPRGAIGAANDNSAPTPIRMTGGGEANSDHEEARVRVAVIDAVIEATNEHRQMDTIRVFVRKGAHNEQRIISFTRPMNVPVKDLFNEGIALDGNQATFAVTGEKPGHVGVLRPVHFVTT